MKHRFFIGIALFFNLFATACHADPLRIQFSTTQCARPCQQASTLQWWMLRDKQAVEIRTLTHQGQLADHSSLWQMRGQSLQTAQAKCHYQYLMHPEKRAIEYTDVDLGLLGIAADARSWAQKYQLITMDERQQLQVVAKETTSAMGYPLVHYQGRLANGAEIELAWLPALNLPYRVHYTYATHTVEIAMQQLLTANNRESRDDVPTMHVGDVLNQYQSVDFTDIGDMEHNPEDVAWLAKAVAAPGVAHAQHAH